MTRYLVYFYYLPKDSVRKKDREIRYPYDTMEVQAENLQHCYTLAENLLKKEYKKYMIDRISEYSRI